MSDAALRAHKRNIEACEAERVEAMRDRDECHGKTEALKRSLRDRGSEVQALRLERDDLRDALRDAERRPGWTVTILTGAAALLVGGATVYVVTAFQ